MTVYRGDPNRNWPLGKSRTPVDYISEKPAKFSSTADGPEYNPEIVMYYSATDVLVMKDEIYNGITFRQTISGTGATYSGINVTASGTGWSYYVRYLPWEQV